MVGHRMSFVLRCQDIYWFFWFFSKLVGEEGPGIPGVKDSSACFIEILLAF